MCGGGGVRERERKVTQDLECEELERPASIGSSLTILLTVFVLPHLFF